MKSMFYLFLCVIVISCYGCGSGQQNIEAQKVEFCSKCYEQKISPIYINTIVSTNKSIGQEKLNDILSPVLRQKMTEYLTKLGYSVIDTNENIDDYYTLESDVFRWEIDKTKTPANSYVTIEFKILDKNKNRIWCYEARSTNAVPTEPSPTLPFWMKSWAGTIFDAISLVDVAIWAKPYIHNALNDTEKELIALSVNAVQMAFFSLPYGPDSQKYKSDKDQSVRLYF